MKLQVRISSESIKIREIKELLESRPDWNNSGVTLTIKEPKVRLRSSLGLDPTVIVAIIEAAGIGLAALITGLMHIVKKSPGKTIIIKGKNGAMLKVPSDTSLEEIDVLIKKAKELDLDEIVLP